MGWIGVIWVIIGILLMIGSGSAVGFLVGFGMIFLYIAVNAPEVIPEPKVIPLTPEQIKAWGEETKYKLMESKIAMANVFIKEDRPEDATRCLRDAGWDMNTLDFTSEHGYTIKKSRIEVSEE